MTSYFHRKSFESLRSTLISNTIVWFFSCVYKFVRLLSVLERKRKKKEKKEQKIWFSKMKMKLCHNAYICLFARLCYVCCACVRLNWFDWLTWQIFDKNIYIIILLNACYADRHHPTTNTHTHTHIFTNLYHKIK